MAERPSGKGPKGAPKKGAVPRRGAAQSPATPKRSYNADRTAALRKNRQDAIAHAKDMAQRMGVQPVDRKTLDEDGERLHVRIAHSGICSRRAAEKLITPGHIETL